MNHVLRQARANKMYINVGNANFGRTVTPSEFKRVISRLGKLLKPFGKWRYYAEPTSTTKLHIHVFMTGVTPVTHADFREAWHHALGELYVARHSSIHFGLIRSIGAVTTYCTGLSKDKIGMPLFRSGTGIRLTGGSNGFFGMSVAALYRRRMHAAHVQRLAEDDPNLLDDPSWERYSALARSEFEANRYSYASKSHRI